MKSWKSDILTEYITAKTSDEVFKLTALNATRLGFEKCAYGCTLPYPLTNSRFYTVDNYPKEWQVRYRERGYIRKDPTVLHGLSDQRPIIWTDDLFSTSQQLWGEAQAHGLKVGIAQSTLDTPGVGSMLTLSRAVDIISPAELNNLRDRLSWLVNVTHMCLSKSRRVRVEADVNVRLTKREIEILRWTADGCTARDISEILSISSDTVNFHLKNSIVKLKTANKTAAAVKAALLGWLN